MAIEQFGAIDSMINNAGVTHDTGGMEFDFVDQLDRAFSKHLSIRLPRTEREVVLSIWSP